jgi:hypothetical protein
MGKMAQSIIFSIPAYQKDSIPVVALVTVVALVMAIVGAWWGLVVMPKQKLVEEKQTRSRIEALVASRSFLAAPQS